MDRYVLDGRALLRGTPQRYHVVTHDLAAQAAEVHGVDAVTLRGLVDRLEERDPEAVELVAAAGDAEPVGWLDVTVESPTGDVVDAAVRLLSEAVTRFALGSDDRTVYARYDDGQVYVALPDGVAPAVPDDLRERLHGVERTVEDVAGGEPTEGVVMALMEETPDEPDGDGGDGGDAAGGDGGT